MEEPQMDRAGRPKIAQGALGFIERPVCRNKANILVAVGVADHDLLLIAAQAQLAAIDIKLEQAIHDRCTVREIIARLKERRKVKLAVLERLARLRIRRDPAEPRLFRKQQWP